MSGSPDTVAMFAYDLPSFALWATIRVAIVDRRVNNYGGLRRYMKDLGLRRGRLVSSGWERHLLAPDIEIIP